MIFIIYFIVMVALALEMDKPQYEYYTFSDRLNIMLTWPGILAIGLVFFIVCAILDFFLNTNRGSE